MLRPEDPASILIEQLKNGLENKHPIQVNVLSVKLFARRPKKDEAPLFFRDGFRTGFSKPNLRAFYPLVLIAKRMTHIPGNKFH
jgi:hypothetical protein